MFLKIRYLFKNRLFFPILLLSGIWFLIILLVNPLGDFPLNDDWAYGKNVYNFTENHIFKFSDWPAMSLIIHVLWGALFCKIFGFSFTVLRISVLILSLAGIVSMYLISFKLSKNYFFSIFLSLLLAFNPFYFSLSYTYMTEVSFIAFLLLSMLFYTKALERFKILFVILATIFAVLSILIRQVGLLVPLSFVITFIIKSKFSIKSVIISILIIIISVLSLLLYEKWLLTIQELPAHYSSVSGLIPEKFSSFFEVLLKRIGILTFYVGLLLFPILIFFFQQIWRNSNLKIKTINLILSLPFLYTFFVAWGHVPIWNILYNSGLGPKLLKDTYYSKNLFPKISDFDMSIIKYIGFIGAFMLVYITIYNIIQVFKINKNNYMRYTKFMFFIAIIIYSVFIILNNHYFDRYNLPFFPLFLLFFIPIYKFRMKIIFNPT